jgi:hypothetical protein
MIVKKNRTLERRSAYCPNCKFKVFENVPAVSKVSMRFKCTCGCSWSMKIKHAVREFNL